VSRFERRVSGMKSLVAAWAVMFAGCVGAQAQAAPATSTTTVSAATMQTEAAVSAGLRGKPLYLRGAWMQNKLTFDGQGNLIGKLPSGPFTLAGFQFSKAKIRGDHLWISGERVGIAFDNNGVHRQVISGLTIDIDNHGGDDFGPAVSAIFADGLSDLTPSMPSYWQAYAQKNFAGQMDTSIKNSTVDIWKLHKQKQQEDGAKTMHVGGSVRPPKLLNSVNPDFTGVARALKANGDVQVYLWVESDGSISHLQVARPAGLGLDENALAAVSQYKFAPAMRDGIPVTVDLYVDVNFRIF